MGDELASGRKAFEGKAWARAYEQLSKADSRMRLEPSDLEMLARSAYLVGKADKGEAALARAHGAYLEAGRTVEAATAAFWIGFHLVSTGEQARGSGWLARAQRLVEDVEHECAVQGFLMIPPALAMLGEGKHDEALEQFRLASEIGERCGESDLMTIGRLGQGKALIKLGQTPAGVRLLDEIMVGVTAGEASPMVTGIVYCAVLSTCHDLFDLQRAREWTAAFARWCASTPDLVPFRGECLIHRAEVKQVHGDWADAMEEAQQAATWLSRPPGSRAAGAAYYRKAELHRLRGAFDEAEEAFGEAARWGRSPQPGLALLRLAQGRAEVAASEIERALGDATDARKRSVLLAAAVEIYLARGRSSSAREAADELRRLAAEMDAPYVSAMQLQAQGAVLLDSESYRDALDTLREALATWRELGAPYECARTQILIARACRALGEPSSCERELDAARRALEELGATPDLEKLDSAAEELPLPGGLTPRELEVLELVASGKTNRTIAEELFISEKTVARHVSNIFLKLDVSSRSAATAYAYEHGLV